MAWTLEALQNKSWFLIVVLVLAAGPYLFWSHFWGRGYIRAAQFDASLGGGRLIVVGAAVDPDTHGDHQYEVRVIDTSDGRRIDHMTFHLPTIPLAHTRGMFWTWNSDDARLVGYEMGNMRRRVDSARTLPLARGPGFRVSKDGASLFATDATGKRYRIDGSTSMATLATDAEASGAVPLPDFQRNANASDDSVALDGGRRLKVDDRYTLHLEGQGVDRALGTYLGGTILARTNPDSGVEEALVFEDTVFVCHYDTLGKGRKLQLSRVRIASGERLWTTRLPKHEKPYSSFLDGTTLIAVGVDDSDQAMAAGIRTLDGALVWHMRV